MIRTLAARGVRRTVRAVVCAAAAAAVIPVGGLIVSAEQTAPPVQSSVAGAVMTPSNTTWP